MSLVPQSYLKEYYYSDLYYSISISKDVDLHWRYNMKKRLEFKSIHNSMVFLFIPKSSIHNLISYFDVKSRTAMRNGEDFIEISRLYFVKAIDLRRAIEEGKLEELRNNFQRNIDIDINRTDREFNVFKNSLEDGETNIFIPPIFTFLKAYAPQYLINLTEEDYVIFVRGQKGFGFLGGKSEKEDSSPYETAVREVKEELYLSGNRFQLDIAEKPIYSKKSMKLHGSRSRSMDYVYIGTISYKKLIYILLYYLLKIV